MLSTTASAQTTTPASRPDGTSIPSSGVLITVLDEARRVCVPITNGQFTETAVNFDTPKPDDLRSLVARLGLDHGPTSVNIHTTPPLLVPPPAISVPKKSPPRGVDVAAAITINNKSRVATMTGLPSDTRNAMSDTGGNVFRLAYWAKDHWVTLGSTIDAPDAVCPVGWFGPDADTMFASGSANPIFLFPGWRNKPWPTWKVRLPATLPQGWYRLTTDIFITGKTSRAHAGASFRI